MGLSLQNLNIGLDIGQLFNSAGQLSNSANGGAGRHGVLNIGQYRKIVSNFSRPYLFLIDIPYIGKNQNVTVFCSSASLPAFKIETSQIKFQDQRLNLGSVARFEEPWSVEFLLDEQHTLRNNLLQWGHNIYDIRMNSHGSPDGYKANNLRAIQLDREGQIMCGVTFVGAFPSNIGSVDFSSQSSTDVGKFNVEFTYDYWYMHYAEEAKEPGEPLGDKTGFMGGLFGNVGFDSEGNVTGNVGGAFGGGGLNLGGAFGF